MKFSIITPTWNCANSIEKTVNSVFIQKNVDVEHLLIDNCSIDNTIELAKSINPKIKITSEKDTGIYNAFNNGWHKASGNVIAFLNADDYYINENVLNDIQKHFQESFETDIVYGNIIVNGKEYKPKTTGILSIDGMRLFHPAVFMRRELLEKLNGFDENFTICADLDLFIRAKLAEVKFVYYNKPLTSFALGGVSTKKLYKTTNEVINILRKNNFSSSYIVKFIIIQYLRDTINYLYYKLLKY